MLVYVENRTAAAAAMENANAVVVSGVIPETNWGGLEVSAPQMVEDNYYILYRMNCGGEPDKWHRSRVQESRKGYYFVAYGRRRYLAEILRVPTLRIPKRF